MRTHGTVFVVQGLLHSQTASDLPVVWWLYARFYSIVLGPFCYAETDCTECLNGGTFLGDSCECPMGFSGTYCEEEGVLIYSLPPYKVLIHMH